MIEREAGHFCGLLRQEMLYCKFKAVLGWGSPVSLPIRGCRIPTSAPGSSAVEPGCEDRV